MSIELHASYLAGAWEAAADDPYVLSIVTYALHRADHPQKDAAFRQLDSFKTHSADYRHVQKEEFPNQLLPGKQPNLPKRKIHKPYSLNLSHFLLLKPVQPGVVGDAAGGLREGEPVDADAQLGQHRDHLLRPHEPPPA